MARTTAYDPDATAFVHRDELFQLKHSVVIDAQAATHEQEAAHLWVARSWALVHPFASGRVFPNFADPELEDWPSAYFGPNYQRLVRVKARYDPSGLLPLPPVATSSLIHAVFRSARVRRIARV